ncbi:MAG TPA: O-antigen ligase family protein [Pseudonocardiaceae bacterium]|jgi:O-antigen ligase|nr:O-antigen ligase family protein [Pseudonocardiaceae bacterium]
MRLLPDEWVRAMRTYRRRVAVVVVLGCGLLGMLAGFTIGSAGGPSYRSTATVVFTAVPADGRGQLSTEARYVETKANTWAALAASGEERQRVVTRTGGMSGATISAVALAGTEMIDVTVTGPTATALPHQATTAGQVLIGLVTALETPPGTATSKVSGALSAGGGPAVSERAGWERWSAVLGGVLGLLVGWLGCTLIRPGRWTRTIDTTAPTPLPAGAAASSAAVAEQIRTLARQARTPRGLVVLGALVFAVAGYGVTGSALPPLIVVLAAGIAGVRGDPRWSAAALLLLGLTVLPDKVELVRVGPITPTVNEVALVLALLAVLPRLGSVPRRRSAVTGPLLIVLAAIAVGMGVGLLRHGEFSEISDTVRAMLMILGFFAIRRAFTGHLPQLIAILLLGAAAASTVELLSAVAGWDRLLVDVRDQVVTGTDLSQVSRLASPVLPLWGPLIILMVSGTVPRRPRWLWLLLIAPGVLHVVLSFNRSTWTPLLGCVILVAAVCYGGRGVLRRALTLGVLGALLVGLAGSGLFGATGVAVSQRVTSVVTGSALDEDSLADRLREDTAAMQTLRDDPLLGTGMGVAYGGQLISYDNFYNITVVTPRPWIHNQYLRIWLLMGVFGVVAFGLLMVRVIALVTRCWSLRVPGAGLVTAAGLGLACVAAQAILQTNLVDRSSVLTVAVLLAVLVLAAEWDPADGTLVASADAEWELPASAGMMVP